MFEEEDEVEEGVGGVATEEDDTSYFARESSISLRREILRCFFIARILSFSRETCEKEHKKKENEP